MSRRTQITLTDLQHAHLVDESIRTGVSMAELIRRAVDHVYRPWMRKHLKGYEVSVGVWKRPDAGVMGRRVRSRL
jgi:transposase-like protein